MHNDSSGRVNRSLPQGRSRQSQPPARRLWLLAPIVIVIVVSVVFAAQLVAGEHSQATTPGRSPIGASATGAIARTPAVTPTIAATYTSAPSNLLTLGAFVDKAPYSQQALDNYASLVGKMPSALLWFQDWGDPVGGKFNVTLMNEVSDKGSTPVISWEPQAPGLGVNQPQYRLQTITDGAHDAYIRQWASGAAAWGKPMYIRFAHEMNGTWYPWSPYINGNGGGDQYIAAWRHVVDIFRQEGASNVRWIWSPNTEYNSYPYSAEFSSMYPGDNYVDWLGLSGYNWGGQNWASFTSIYSSTYKALTRLTSKPILITEIGCAEDGGSKAAWITSTFLTEIPHTFSHIRGVLWFDASRQEDWHVNTSPSALAAFRQVVQSPLYQGRLP